MRTGLLAALAAVAVCIPSVFAQRDPQKLPPGAQVFPVLRVVSVSPSPEALGVALDSPVVVEFDRAVDPGSLSAASFHVLGRWSGPVAGQFEQPNARTVVFTRGRGFSPAERVMVNLSRGVRALDGGTLARGYAWGFWGATAPGSMVFLNTGELVPGTIPYGGHGGDLDNDGDLDLAVPNEQSSNVSVFLNNGDGMFGARQNFGVGFHCSPSEGLDLSGDGIVDLAVANILANNVSILIGKGDGTFWAQVLYPVGSQPRGLAAFDADGDGDADLVTANRASSNLSLLRNRGDGTFDPRVNFEGGVNGETGVGAADVNGDGVSDLVVIGYSNSRIATLVGDGAGGFALKASVATSQSPWMVNVGDFNGDGFVDAAVACSGASRAGVYFGDGAGGLSAETAILSGSFPIAIDVGDLDGDGDLDMVTSSYNSGDFHVYSNNGAGVFTFRFILDAPSAGSCAVLHDRDGDGDTDITGIDEVADRVLLFTQQ